MFDVTDNDLLAVYEQLKDTYTLTWSNTFALDAGFTIDCPIIVGNAHRQILWLYNDDGIFVLDVMDAEHTKGTHWHPNDVDSAIDDIVEFMEGKSNYELYPFNQI